MEIQGKIKKINETQIFGSNGFQKRELVVTINDQYPQTVLVEFVQDKCDILNNYKIGDEVTISINLRGKEWISPEGNTKYFNTIQGRRITKLTTETSITTMPPLPQSENYFENNEDGDLPF